MKEFAMLLGFGAGMVTGMLLFKHSQNVKQAFNQSEKTVMQGIEKGEQAIKKEAKMIKKGAEKAVDKTEQALSDGVKKLKKKMNV